ncbi:MAG TPA: glycosyltransferase [Bellilinea sp.]|nr:glycosyltransferase [Bellilinea sp.]
MADEKNWATFIRKLRWWVLNPENFPVKMARLVRRAFQVLREEGLGPFLTAIPRKILFWMGIHPQGFTPANAFRTLKSLSQLSKTQNNRVDILVFPIIDWDFRFQRPQQLAKQFAQNGYRVFYFAAHFQDGSRPVLREIEPNLYEVILPGTPGTNIYREAMQLELQEKLRQACLVLADLAQINEAVQIVDLPFWSPLAFSLRQSLGWKVIYDCMDSHADFPDTTAEMLAQEQSLFLQSDWVITSSRPLINRIQQFTQRVSLVLNAGEFSHFSQTDLARPSEIAGLRGPIIGYYGAISAWFDAGIIAELAAAHPEWNFVLIGNTHGADLSPVAELPQVLLLGEKPYDTLPAYLAHFDAAIIPFRRTPLTDATNPVKLFEYLSAGKPVIASRLTELEHYEDTVTLCSTAAEWIQAVEAALEDSDAAVKAQRIAVGQQNTWERRFQQIEATLKEIYPPVSILIITYNNLAYNQLCLDSILQKTAYPNYEIVVVDNASMDETPAFLEGFAREHSEHQVILNRENLGFAAANNQAARAAHGDYLIFLNNDTVVTPGWINGLLLALNEPGVGMAGPATNWAGNESRIPVSYKDLSDMEDFARKYVIAHRNKRVEQSMLAFFCVAISREKWDEIGGLDERFGMGMFEDDDYGIRVHRAGYQVICTHGVFIHHWGRTSFSKIDQQKYKRLFEENRLKFEEKWNIVWEDPAQEGEKKA